MDPAHMDVRNILGGPSYRHKDCLLRYENGEDTVNTQPEAFSGRLQTLAQKLTEMAQEAADALARSTEEERAAKQVLSKPSGSDDLAGIARRIYAERRTRERHLQPDLFREPAWDILLDLFIQHSASRSVSVTSAAIASNVPMSTALRYIARLEAAGLVVRKTSRSDDRVVLLELTECGCSKMMNYLSDCRRSAVLRESDASHQP